MRRNRDLKPYMCYASIMTNLLSSCRVPLGVAGAEHCPRTSLGLVLSVFLHCTWLKKQLASSLRSWFEDRLCFYLAIIPREPMLCVNALRRRPQQINAELVAKAA